MVDGVNMQRMVNSLFWLVQDVGARGEEMKGNCIWILGLNYENYEGFIC